MNNRAMDSKTILAIILSIGIFTAWQKLYVDPRLPRQQPPAAQHQREQTQTTAEIQPAQTPAQPPGAAPPAELSAATPSDSQPIAAGQTVVTRTGDAVIGNGANILDGWQLREYRQRLENEASNVDLLSVTHSMGAVQLAFNDPRLSYLENARGTLTPIPNGAHWAYEDANILIERDVTGSADQPWLDVRISGRFKNAQPSQAYLSVSQHSAKSDPEANDRQVFFFAGDSLKRVVVKEHIDLTQSPGPVRYVGAGTRYFELAVVPQGPGEARGVLQPTDAYAAQASLAWPLTSSTFNIPVKVYFGPKDLDVLRSVDPDARSHGRFRLVHDLRVSAPQAPASSSTRSSATTASRSSSSPLLIKLAHLPAHLQEHEEHEGDGEASAAARRSIREKYKDDKEALNRETLAMMRTHGYNPIAGCLPMVIQMPIFFALYRVLYSSIELYHAPFVVLDPRSFGARTPFTSRPFCSR